MASRMHTTDDKAAADVLAAFDAARLRNEEDLVKCYRAAAAAWRRHHPGTTSTYAAHRAVAVILDKRLPDFLANLHVG